MKRSLMRFANVARALPIAKNTEAFFDHASPAESFLKSNLEQLAIASFPANSIRYFFDLRSKDLKVDHDGRSRREVTAVWSLGNWRGLYFQIRAAVFQTRVRSDIRVAGLARTFFRAVQRRPTQWLGEKTRTNS
jgi:hypothetical protein